MNPELRWVPSPLVSCLHAAELVLRQALGNSAQDYESFAKEVHNWLAVVDAAVGHRENFWRHVLPLAAQPIGRRELIDVTLRKTGTARRDHEAAVDQVLEPFTAVEAAYRDVHPKLDTELENRVLPLKDQWEARGPGLWFQLGRQLPQELLVDQADVILVHPVGGGGGRPLLQYNRVLLEAVLYDPIPELPEVVRLGWLLAQLQMDLPAISETVPADRLELIAGLALLPPVLEAAHQVELVAPPETALPRALKLWNLLPPSADLSPNDLATWWQTRENLDTPWHVALAALDRMVGY